MNYTVIGVYDDCFTELTEEVVVGRYDTYEEARKVMEEAASDFRQVRIEV